MTPEFERPRFRRGKNASRPYGGNVSDESFPQALHKLAVSRGFESQSALARAFGFSQGNVSEWYRGKSIPSPESLGNLLTLFDLDNKEQGKFVEQYANQFAEQKASFRLKISRSSMQTSNNPIGKWIEDFCNKRSIILKQWSASVGLSTTAISRRASLGLDTLSLILQNAPEAFDLSQEETEDLSETVVLEIQQRLQEGKSLRNGPAGREIHKMQKSLVYSTYNGEQTAVELGVTRATVSNLRKKFGLPYLLTQDNLTMLREHLEKTKGRREKFQQSMMRKRTGNLGETDLTIFQ